MRRWTTHGASTEAPVDDTVGGLLAALLKMSDEGVPSKAKLNITHSEGGLGLTARWDS